MLYLNKVENEREREIKREKFFNKELNCYVLKTNWK